jgi:uncharacterized protein
MYKINNRHGKRENMRSKIEMIKQRMTSELSCSAHNIDHVMRVYNLCKLIAETESNVEMDVLEPAALLHDIARVKESNDNSGETDHAVLGAEMAGEILNELAYPPDLIEKIKHCILTHRYRTNNEPKTIEAKILFDADKLDVIGSVGIARTYMLAGQFDQRIMASSSALYEKENIVDNGRIKNLSKHSPYMEYEYKFKNIPDKLYTQKGKQMGKERLTFMDSFFLRLKEEVNGTL